MLTLTIIIWTIISTKSSNYISIVSKYGYKYFSWSLTIWFCAGHEWNYYSSKINSRIIMYDYYFILMREERRGESVLPWRCCQFHQVRLSENQNNEVYNNISNSKPNTSIKQRFI